MQKSTEDNKNVESHAVVKQLTQSIFIILLGYIDLYATMPYVCTHTKLIIYMQLYYFDPDNVCIII